MTRRLVMLGIVAAWIASVSPAAAHPVGVRDPFDPAISLTQPGAAESGTATGAVAVDAEVVQAPGPRRGLPQTGASLDGWVLAAYFLVAAGLALLLWAWSKRPPRPHKVAAPV